MYIYSLDKILTKFFVGVPVCAPTSNVRAVSQPLCQHDVSSTFLVVTNLTGEKQHLILLLITFFLLSMLLTTFSQV